MKNMISGPRMQIDTAQVAQKLENAADLRIKTGSQSGSSDSASLLSSSAAIPSKDEFFSFMKQALGETEEGKVSEEELYAAFIEQQLQLKSKEAADAYKTAEAYSISQHQLDDGYVCLEQVANEALGKVVKQGKISAAEAAVINGQAYEAVQLDYFTQSLHDAQAGTVHPGSPTASLDESLTEVFNNFTDIREGKLVTNPLDVYAQLNTAAPASTAAPVLLAPAAYMPAGLDETSAHAGASDTATHTRRSRPRNNDDHGSDGGTPASNPRTPSTGGGTVAGPGSTDPYVAPPNSTTGFAWNPDNNGTASVAMPQAVSGDLDRVELHSDLPAAPDTKLDDGRYTGTTETGQATYSFSRPGQDYGSDVVVVGFRTSGTQVAYEVADSSQPVAA
jgi:hypothetical protein